MMIQRIAYKSVSSGAGCVYVFSIWAGGIYACYRKAMYASGTHTPVYNHKIHAEISTGKRFIIIEHRADGKHKIYLDDIKKARWLRQTINYASDETGIGSYTLRSVLRKIQKMVQDYPDHAMLGKSVASSVKKKKKPKSKSRPAKVAKLKTAKDE